MVCRVVLRVGLVWAAGPVRRVGNAGLFPSRRCGSRVGTVTRVRLPGKCSSALVVAVVVGSGLVLGSRAACSWRRWILQLHFYVGELGIF